MFVKAENRISLAKIAEHLGVCKKIIYTWFSERSMPMVKAKKSWKFKVSEFEVWSASGGAC